MTSVNSSMLKYQNKFAIEFAKLMQEKLPKWKKIQSAQRKDLYSFPTICSYLFISLLGFIPGKREYHYDLKLHCWLAVIFFIAVVIGTIKENNKHYQNSVKRTCFRDLLGVFDKSIRYGYAALISVNYYQNSDLFPPDKVTHTQADDCFYGTFKDVDFKINELEVGYQYRTKNGYQFAPVFKGASMLFKMNKCIKNRVLIISKSLINKVPKGYKKVDIEYNRFAAKYNVYVNGGDTTEAQVEARYLLNTAFLDRFMQLQTSFRVRKICCSIYLDNMLVMLSTRRDLFEFNHLFGRIDDPKQYKTLFDEFASVLSFIEVLNLSSKTKL